MFVLLCLERRALYPSLPGVAVRHPGEAAAQLVWEGQEALLSSSPTEPARYTHTRAHAHAHRDTGGHLHAQCPWMLCLPGPLLCLQVQPHF